MSEISPNLTLKEIRTGKGWAETPQQHPEIPTSIHYTDSTGITVIYRIDSKTYLNNIKQKK